MSTEQANGKIMEEKKDKVAEVTEKFDNLAVDSTNEANENKPARRGGRGFRGRGRGRGRGGRVNGRFQPRPPYDEQVKQIEEDLKSKKVLEKGVKGYVKWFSVRGRYGFVAREKASDEKEDFFVHQTAIAKSSTIKYYLRTLDDDEPVVFDIVEGRKGPEAANVTGPDGENVRGSRFARSLIQRWGVARRGGHRNTGSRKPREEGDGEKPSATEESGDGEARGKRRPRRARGKLQPDAENDEKPQEKGDGDAAADGEKKGRRRNNNRTKGKKEAGEAAEQKQESAPVKA
ncbi:CBN-CEY-4 protein [Caenorhabditis brenneri]|uniref:CBN-CEY-4 protein n=1 Tax=Caenorhabditis brenneri TaxID=135651 RepID=G0ML16_CAEBE|nr:CBN-CEY-4 protein [Caenorhabditis brenneri]